jgi:hypothetical protein
VFMRVVRFTEVNPETIEAQLSGINESGGPPEGIKATGIQVVVDRAQGTAVVLQFFDSADDMRSSEQAFDSMDSSDTPGKRVSVDRGEVMAEMHATA